MSNSLLLPPANPSLARSNRGADALIRRLESKRRAPASWRLGGSSMACIRCETRDDAFYIRKCVELARTAVGCTSPNPMVGCVIVRDGEIVGQGFHPRAGQPHAEVFALKDAGSLAENATAYVSLEPCNHYGRTPPCTEALIRAKVKQVVVGMVDPNPIVSSKGVARLRDAGIEVITGVEEMLCQKLNEAYIHRILTGRPFVMLRYSLSWDGRIIDKLGRGAEEKGGYYSQLLQENDGIIIPDDMLTKISTLPTSHETGANQPFHIVMAKGVTSPLHLPGIPEGSVPKIIVLADNDIKVEPQMEGIEIVVLEKITISSVLDYCGQRGLCSIMLDFRGCSECVSELLEYSIAENLVQKIVMELFPIWRSSAETSQLPSKPLMLKNFQSKQLTESVLFEGYI